MVGGINGFQQQWLTNERGLAPTEASNSAGLYMLIGTVLGLSLIHI